MSVLIAGYSKVSLIDYPGKVATTVFLSGCNFTCGYCHNHSLIDFYENKPALYEAFFSYLKKRQGLLDGVCITGGEPLLSKDIYDFVKKIKDLGYLIKLDTNGSFPKKLSQLIEEGLIDYVAMDIKTAFPYYHEITGKRDLENKVQESLSILVKSKISYELRTTFIKPLHTMSVVELMFDSIKGNHLYYLQNFKMSDEVKERAYSPFSKEEMETFLSLAKRYLPRASLREI